ncbi:hypothetical protein [Prevotella melaninogenica]|uniref:hypothetical protein n=1 Tax=Prevotella melaninogenica TaxID=28132 RepID=UPI001C5FF6F4|nr:hypothetical protein [Prevotella melaninogenica]MBW4730124.1 hypothetical protein [Prevotella melaninogenica]MBW4732255.1 hypothetical protein [Prevotella melaninogenica]MBW4750309.1 hypothetical protein [Prevotella melaninogenica]
MESNKGNWGRYGLQAFGISVLGPLLFYLINPIIEHFKGNRDAVAYTKTYVNQWDSIKITLPNNLFEQMMQEGSIRVKILASDSKGKHRIEADNKIFYISQYKKYFELIWIDGVDEIVGLYNRHYDAAGVQNGLMRAGMVLSVYVNRKQWKDKSYGTIEKPMPVFLHRIISGDDIEERNKFALWRDSLQPGGDFVDSYLPPKAVQRMRNTPDSVNYKFAEYYLRYLLPEDEFERLFEEK